MEILKSKNQAITTSELLKATDKFPDLCQGCKSGSNVISAGLKLMKKGLVKREVGKGGFLWSLI